MHWLPNTDRSFCYRTIDLIETTILKDITEKFSMGVQTYVLCVDEPRLRGAVEKGRYTTNLAEAKRDKSASKSEEVVPYGPNAQLCYEGIRPDVINHPDDIELLNTRRLMHPECRFLRRHLWDLVAVYLMTEAFVVPAGCMFIYDHTFQGPLIIQGTAAGCVRSENNIAYASFNWEADITMWFWAEYFHKHEIWIISTDSDVIPIGLHFMYNTGHQRPIYWIDKVGAKFTYCHLNKFLDILLDEEKWDMRYFNYTTLICGTDFIEKSWICDRASAETIYTNILQLCHEQRKPKKSNSMKLPSISNVRELQPVEFYRFCQYARGKLPVQMDKMFKSYTRRFQFNHQTWFRNWKAVRDMRALLPEEDSLVRPMRYLPEDHPYVLYTRKHGDFEDMKREPDDPCLGDPTYGSRRQQARDDLQRLGIGTFANESCQADTAALLVACSSWRK